VQSGDKVKLKDDTGYYTVVRRLSSKTILVRTDDGLEIPLPIEDLIISTLDPDIFNVEGYNKAKRGRSTKPAKSLEHKIRSCCPEIDLHMQGSYSGYESFSTIDIQIMRFRAELDKAIREGKKEIVFIHGVGSGKLREKIQKIIHENYISCNFQDASFNKYGVDGATLITISKQRKKLRD